MYILNICLCMHIEYILHTRICSVFVCEFVLFVCIPMCFCLCIYVCFYTCTFVCIIV